MCIFELFAYNTIFHVKNKPLKMRIFVNHDKCDTKRFLEERIPEFRPLFNGEYLQTILGLVLSVRKPMGVVWKHISNCNSHWWMQAKTFQNGDVVICVPGFCGNVKSHYINQLSHSCLKMKIDLVVLDIRSTKIGDTSELHNLVTLFKQQYNHIYIVGVSIGGNIVCRYCSEKNIDKSVKLIVSVGNGFDLRMMRDTMNDSLSKLMFYYCKRWLSLLKYEIKSDKGINSVWDTICYVSNEDIDTYLYKNSSHETFTNSVVPLFIINSIDDPFFSFSNLKNLYDTVNLNKNITIITTQVGGHIGWCKGVKNVSWFFDDVLPIIIESVK